jgi:eukaryotic-like serine/threonine-protein kinase
MNPDRWTEIDRLYNSVLDREPGERLAFLDRNCPDEELRREVQSLLEHASAGDQLLEICPWKKDLQRLAISEELRPSLTPGMRLGPYEIVAAIGAGGMGEVYRARDTRLDRPVAIKVVASTWANDPQWRGRFDCEGRAISKLNHPHICTLHDVGHQDGIDFLVMEYLDGETLADRLHRGALRIEEAVRLAVHLADALDEAHGRGFIHRDIKPANIFLTTRGDPKILDFGLAKIELSVRSAATSGPTITELDTLTGAGTVVGTVAYMSPEQMRGLPVDQRTDLFSLGVVLYEMVTRERPFAGSSADAVIDAVLHAKPRDFGDTPLSAPLKSLIRKLLEKDPARRHGSAREVHRELKAIEASLTPVWPMGFSRVVWVAVGIAFVVASALAGWLWHRSSRERWAIETATPEITRLVDAGEYVKAAALTREARVVLPKNPTLEKLWMASTGEFSIASVPSGADISIRPYRGDPNAWRNLGQTPLKRIRIPQDAYVLKVVKSGFAPQISIFESLGPDPPGARFASDWTWKLRPEGSVPTEMVVVPGDWVGLNYPLAEAPALQVDDFLIDRHEVTNEEYKRFLEAGGYQKREFWKQPFVKDGRAIPWEDAIAFFHDATGRPGPATWEAGGYPKGHEKHPVAGVSWFEAAAYAEFAGKSLPTAYHWLLASQAGDLTALISRGGNFQGEGTQSVGSAGVLSGNGTTDMAGNVKEWCWNEARDARRLILGGGFGEPRYMFSLSDSQSPWDRLANFGFRCIKLDSRPAAAAVARLEVTTRDYANEKPASDEVFKAYTALYAYDKGRLNARVERTEVMEGWSRVKVTFDAAYGHERVTAYLFLPKNGAAPLQPIVYFPGAIAFLDDKLDLSNCEDAIDFFLKSGRALVVPIYKGMYERRDGMEPGRKPPAFFRDHVIAWSKDLGRTLDYLETRKDIDNTKVAYFGVSVGATEGGLLPALEKRIKLAILSSGGLPPKHDLPEVDPLNFVSRVKIPVLMLSGRYDDEWPLESSQLPLFRFLGTPSSDKRQVIYEGGHCVFPRPAAVRECLDWLDKYLGPVRH